MGLPAGKVTNDPSNYFAIAQQSAKDTDGTSFYFLKHLDGSGFDVDVTASKERVGGSGRQVGLTYRTKVTSDGQFVQYVQPDFIGRVLALALPSGDTVVAGPSNGAGNAYYSTHTITDVGSQLPYFTAEQNWADQTERTTNCIVSSLKFEGDAGKPIKATIAFMSGGTPHGLVSPQVPVREAAFPIMYAGASMAITADYALTPGAASSIQLTKWSVEIKNELDGNIQTNALNREDMLWLNQDFDVDCTLKYINNAVWEQVQFGGGSQVPQGVLTAGAFTFSATNPSSMGFTLLLPFVEFDSVKVNRLDPDGKTMYLDAVASTKNIGSTAVVATVISGASTAYSSSTT